MALTRQELELIRRGLGREPTAAELAFFTSHWSEHCSYKSTRRWLRELPGSAPWVVRGRGTDAPLVEVAPGLYVSFKIESHNHPSAVDPYNGAATGVGGIIRDILTVGATPVALLVNLHFGPPEDPHARWIFSNVVKGISDYGNRVGVPVVGGETWFDEDFTYTPIVLATCVGVVEAEAVPRGGVAPGDYLVVAGLGADRSGLGGSAFASKTLEGGEDLGAVQVADPLMGKKLIDVVREAGRCVKFIKDLGGGGLATALAELSSWFSLGIEFHLDKLHVRDRAAAPEELLISETQERLIFVVSPQDLPCLEAALRRYEVPYSIPGRFVEGGRVWVMWRGERVVDIPISLADGAPEVLWPQEPYQPPELPQLPEPPLEKALDLVLSSPNVAKKESIYMRFDFDVGVKTAVKPGEGDAAVLKLYQRGQLGLVVKGDANPRYTFLDPRLGAANAFVKAYRNVAVVGGVPLAAVDSINVGSPERPRVYWQFVQAVQGLREAAAELEVPIVGGKVSLYNEYMGRPVKPTVAVVVLGRIDDVSKANRAMWREGDRIFVWGVTRGEVGGSEYLKRVHGVVAGRPPAVDYGAERKIVDVVQSWLGRLTGATDVGVGGLAAALAKMAVNSGVGATVDVCRAPSDVGRLDFLLFSESNGRFVAAGEEGPGVAVGEAHGDVFEVRCGGTLLYKRRVEELRRLMLL
ncbi:phosphoribosylformylglycinamidine synthase subunit PurL [Pyrobaculum neutrophilum]|uniref:Phosphoribosylformylglycinamidine synthase subunit PurL n=1 Tax=Pyrobaculum neutrophilum (strain DSM 2338 / JCM 9278 / NBRC 100436 / V24Sta) TaxID=444157 RepID=PURL_PYRNV|nr:phosphoribosylformylglycinamidine synthase subunit PurL [Pyrobaculum neutrophilum]B1YBM5.1 RecName: Full=Phosphoribosylformylglycinamidine synthase subunit PurL; Short=FGAM synthase; AltName: Full=Formylglycinamide ribonucleotide amidotransferase subunit II; Short=FGAR amidotransferase II; Short=FGAR-AT II; AltName: Full=Glutamine amidotransferase PurL; AltName: Full=Phosphoribosylformylglycinamidine synthase subunit II [Pyrobaculum neutrophilum V24Sta]ACB40827.1 phosphoribosylformylglycinamid